MSPELTEKSEWPDKYVRVLTFLLMFSMFIAGEIWPRGTHTYKVVGAIILLLMVLVGIMPRLPRLFKTRDQNISRVVLFLYAITLIMLAIMIFIDSLPLLIASGVILLIGLLADTLRVRAFFARLGRSSGDGVQRS